MKQLVLNAARGAMRMLQLDRDAAAIAEVLNGGLEVEALAAGTKFSVSPIGTNGIADSWVEKYGLIVMSSAGDKGIPWIAPVGIARSLNAEFQFGILAIAITGAHVAGNEPASFDVGIYVNNVLTFTVTVPKVALADAARIGDAARWYQTLYRLNVPTWCVDGAYIEARCADASITDLNVVVFARHAHMA